MTDKLICQVYASARRDETYLYVERGEDDLANIPEELLAHFGQPRPVLVLVLTADKKLARVKAVDVIESIKRQGFYLQMPPERDVYALDLYRAPTEGRY